MEKPIAITSIQCDTMNPMLNTDTQFALYSGDCDMPVAVACNDDEDFSNDIYNSLLEVETEMGVTYLLMVDGYIEPNYEAIGTFCIEVTRQGSVGVSNLKETAYHVFPNPTTGQIQLDGFTADRIEVLDQLGRIVQVQAVEKSNSCDLSSLRAGVYMLKMTVGTEVYSTKVVKE
jgi:hypothetical protein